MTLSKAISLIESSKFESALNDIAKSKKHALSAIKILNQLNKTTPNDPLIQQISLYVLTWFENIGKQSLSSKIVWLASRVGGNFYPPVLKIMRDKKGDEFPPILVSSNSDNQLRMPSNIIANFEARDSVQGSNHDLENLYQDLLTNCSFVCAILSVIHRRGEFLLQYNTNEDRSIFRFYLFFNGTWRSVVVDNKVPILSGPRNIVIRSITNEDVWWPAFLEKAYLQVMGQGYEFQGSNFANDTFMLLGWLPEVMRMTTRIPQQVIAAYLKGDAVIGLGVDSISDKLASHLDLVPDHDYVIVDIKYENGENYFCIKNPWLVQNRTRWYSDSELYHFAFLYINWNPLFANKVSMTFIGKHSPNTYEQSQFSLKCQGETWILLERHYGVSANNCKDSEIVIGLGIFETKQGEKVLTSDQYKEIVSTKRTNNRTELVKVNLKEGLYTVVVFTSQQCNLTITAYSNQEIDLVKAKNLFPETLSINDAWYIDCSGGNSALTSFVDNPQFLLEIPQDQQVQMALFGELPEQYYSIHIYPVTLELRNPTPSIHEINYKMGSTSFLTMLAAGSYRIYCSTYDVLRKSTPTKFKLIVNAQSGVKLTKALKGNGKFTIRKKFNWDNKNRHKLFFETMYNFCRLKIRVTYGTGQNMTYRPMMRASIFCATAEVPIHINETWDDSVYGVYVECTIQRSHKYILLVERLEPGEGESTIEIGASSKISLIEN